MSDLYRLLCEKPAFHMDADQTVWHNQRCYVKVEPISRIMWCKNHHAEATHSHNCRYADNPMMNAAECDIVRADVYEVPKEDEDE